jgi:cephalosporin hydroxylase
MEKNHMKLADIHNKYDTDKGTYHSYINKYDELFAPFQDKRINFLEIGCLTCGSIKMFNEYFAQGHIYGIDNWEQNTDHMGQLLQNKGINLTQIVDDINQNYPKVKLITCDSTNKDAVVKKLNGMKFEIIIDDGDHRTQSQFETFKNFIPLLEKGGVYVIEDVGNVQELLQVIINYITENNLNVSVTSNAWYKNNRADDAILVVR